MRLKLKGDRFRVLSRSWSLKFGRIGGFGLAGGVGSCWVQGGGIAAKGVKRSGCVEGRNVFLQQ